MRENTFPQIFIDMKNIVIIIEGLFFCNAVLLRKNSILGEIEHFA